MQYPTSTSSTATTASVPLSTTSAWPTATGYVVTCATDETVVREVQPPPHTWRDRFEGTNDLLAISLLLAIAWAVLCHILRCRAEHNVISLEEATPCEFANVYDSNEER